jgi:hypothetical protein
MTVRVLRYGVVVLVLASAACGGSPADAESVLQRVVLQPGDAGDGYTQDSARVITNEDAARARPDTRQAGEQYDAWRQQLRYTVELAAPPESVAVFSTGAARIINSAALYDDAEGAAAGLAWLRGLDAAVLADTLHSEGEGTGITDTQASPIDDLAAFGDESFGLRVSGKATFGTSLTSAFVADTVFVRAGRITGNVTVVALGQAPRRDVLLALVERFVERARSEQ